MGDDMNIQNNQNNGIGPFTGTNRSNGANGGDVTNGGNSNGRPPAIPDGSPAGTNSVTFNGTGGGGVQLPTNPNPMSSGQYQEYLNNSFMVQDPQLNDVLNAANYNANNTSRNAGGANGSGNGSGSTTAPSSGGGSAFQQLDALYRQMENSGEMSTDDMQRLTVKMQRLQQIIAMINQIRNIHHQMMQDTIRKMA